MLDNDPLWYKDAIIYELHVRAFHDSVGDGTGDFRGLIQKLDYLRDLGITAIWLLPFYPSPLKDDGYDIADYTTIHPDYGSMADVKAFLDAAHQRGLRVITELVINHTSDQHPWFQRARRSPPGSSERNFYVWSDNPDKYKGVRIIFKDFEPSNWTWDSVANAYYWHRFYHHQPDLNYDNPDVWKAIFPVVDFWFNLGVDGMRLDAVPYLFEEEGTSCENLPKTHVFLRALRQHIDERFPNRMLLAEANQWPEDAVVYFGNGDECHMNFHFPLMPRMFMSLHVEDRFPIIDILDQTPGIPENCQWALFLRNHDELTLEMVTDEERDYMYRAYAHDPQARINLGIRRRLGPLLGNDRRRIELMNGLLFSLPGTPVLYYGEEIGMGDNIYLGDRNSVRTPMQWSADRNAGFSRANPQRLYSPVIIDPEYHYEAINVEAQQNNAHSLLWWMKRLMALRKRYRAFGRGTLEFLHPDNRAILAFLREYAGETLLVVANLSRFVQYVELDLSRFDGLVPVELFSRQPFPPLTKQPYLLTMGPHSFYWFSLQTARTGAHAERQAAAEAPLPVLTVNTRWQELFEGLASLRIEAILPAYLLRRRWFAGADQTIKSAAFKEIFPLQYAQNKADAFFTLVAVDRQQGQSDLYSLPLAFAEGAEAERLLAQEPHLILARVTGAQEGLLIDALADLRFCRSILNALSGELQFESSRSTLLQAVGLPELNEARQPEEACEPITVSKADQINSSVLFGQRLILKVFRRVDEGVNPDLDISRYLTANGFAHTPPVLGWVEYRRKRKAEAMTLAVLHGFLPNQGDALQLTLDELSRFFEQVLTRRDTLGDTYRTPPPVSLFLDILERDPPPVLTPLIESFLSRIRLLGRRTAEMHLALAEPNGDPAFTPEPFTLHYQRGLYQTFRNSIGQVFHQLRHALPQLPPAGAAQARELLAREAELLDRFRVLIKQPIHALRTRIHGDFNLAEVLYTGKDFVVIDFEGEARRTLSDRRTKRSPLRDVASMVRAFHMAAHSLLEGETPLRGRLPGIIRSEDVELLHSWAQLWYSWVSAAFVRSYWQAAEGANFLPRSQSEFRLLMQTYLLDRTLHELGQALEERPSWAQVPMLGVQELLPTENPSDG